ncbi:MAG: hypothetical protein CMD02_03560 [Flavobacteriales bacterium]|nr:hypothetical protein [Flavobacteriales bacterium]|tara:strand:+ start:1260 stop:1637 length:378 start_codon:yes stop_codon:yes gene_type:complete
MKKTLLKTSSVILLLFFITITFTSCEKEKNTIGVIKVVNSSGQTMSGVTVVLNQQNTIPGTDPIENLRKTGTTDATGRVSFTYKHEAILDVNVNKTSGNDTYSGSGVIRLLRGKTEQITVEAVKQ